MILASIVWSAVMLNKKSLETWSFTLNSSLSNNPLETNTEIFSVNDSYVTVKVLVPWNVGVHICGIPSVNVPSANCVQFPIGIATGNRLPLMSILVAFISRESSAVIVPEEVISSREAISP